MCFLRAQLADDRAEDTGADRLLVVVDQHRGVANRSGSPSRRGGGCPWRCGRSTARWTSPFFTRPRGAASLTETTMMSPTPAKRRLEPPSTLMHWTRLAPLCPRPPGWTASGSSIDSFSSIHLRRPASATSSASAPSSASRRLLGLGLGLGCFGLRPGFGASLGRSRRRGLGVPTRSSTVQVFSFEIGAHLLDADVSPALNALPSSWA